VSSEIYDTLSADTGPFFAYSIDPQLDIASVRFGANIDVGRDWFRATSTGLLRRRALSSSRVPRS
jgi:hypothetical protein